MKCDRCGQHEATYFYEEKVNGITKKMNLCEKCAAELNLLSFSSISDFEFPSLFNTLSSGGYKVQDSVCTACGTRLSDFSESGYLGCSKCYEQFKDALGPVLRRMYTKTKHIGKMPKTTNKKLSVKETCEVLKEQLKQKIEQEDYEEAAVIRDKLKKLTGNL